MHDKQGNPERVIRQCKRLMSRDKKQTGVSGWGKTVKIKCEQHSSRSGGLKKECCKVYSHKWLSRIWRFHTESGIYSIQLEQRVTLWDCTQRLLRWKQTGIISEAYKKNKITTLQYDYSHVKSHRSHYINNARARWAGDEAPVAFWAIALSFNYLPFLYRKWRYVWWGRDRRELTFLHTLSNKSTHFLITESSIIVFSLQIGHFFSLSFA